MKLLGKLKKRKVASEYVRPVTKVICDKCGKELDDTYARIITSHGRWGNDSGDSVECYDLCFECAKKMFEEYLENPEYTDNFEYECTPIDLGEEIVMDKAGNIGFFDRDKYEIDKENDL